MISGLCDGCARGRRNRRLCFISVRGIPFDGPALCRGNFGSVRLPVIAMILEGRLERRSRMMRQGGRRVHLLCRDEAQGFCGPKSLRTARKSGLDAQCGCQHKLVGRGGGWLLQGTVIFGHQTADRRKDVFNFRF